MHRPQFSLFVQHLQSSDVGAAKTFWTEYLKNAQPTCMSWETDVFNVSKKTGTGDLRLLTSRATSSTGVLIYAAWALILSRHTGNSDVTFAVTL